MIKLAFLTLVEMNFDVSWMAMSKSVRSPEALSPSLICSLRTCLFDEKTGRCSGSRTEHRASARARKKRKKEQTMEGTIVSLQILN